MQSAVDGHNVCIFAYGQTGSGKTFTMNGTNDMPGLTPRSITELYDIIGGMDGYEVKLQCYMVEIYKGELRDMFLPKDVKERPKIDVKMSAEGNVTLTNIMVRDITSMEECKQMFEEGLGGRQVRATKMNDESSRSHLIFSVVVQSLNKMTGKTQCGKISFIDLAGSESSKKT